MHFKGDAVKEFLKVLIYLAKDGVKMLVKIFDGRQVGEGDIDTRFVLAISKDVRWEGIGIFQPSRQGGGDDGAEVCLYCMHN